MIQILLVDDHPSVGEGTKSMIEQDVEMQVTVVTSSMEALELINNQTFDVLMFDLNMPVINGLELTRRVITTNSDTPIIIYSGYDIAPHFNVLVESRVAGFVSKTASREQLITAIRCALHGEAVIPVSLLHQLRRNDARVAASVNEEIKGISIDEREQAILREVSKGKGNREIADILLISQRTVEYNLTRIFGKLNVRSRAEAIVEAKRLGLIPSEDFI
ncbi:response regulator transcription factor [Desulfosporosinus meridiei]|uniref:Stage 0 sporulation protein A homolog n=1 Tax=Desulfosporosinus meridiei (strain ATCC BAA-275 / DSM 13257 / KCTC 12902 / NCIMB 13706 / S10) TaxID=768704 RepID=J7IXY7_DESMD|nr:response regulator transcription factor [Desulfosporosinus meridiei]AFQ43968.1 response regulator containing a CheY-like receiver domain and an HTH DNA-binding domain [Desulfosporosinus meridiei DSM 13257]